MNHEADDRMLKDRNYKTGCIIFTFMLKVLFSVILMVLTVTGFLLNAQENQEAKHAAFRIDSERLYPIRPEESEDNDLIFRAAVHNIAHSDEQVFVRIPGQSVAYKLLLNGFRCGSDPGGPLAAEFRITPFLKEENRLVIEFDSTGAPGMRSCLYGTDRPVMIRREPLHIRDLVINQFGSSEDEALVRIHLYLKSYRERPQESLSLEARILDPGGIEVHKEKLEISSLPAYGQETELFLDQFISSPVLWSPSEPLLYRAELICSATGQVKEKSSVAFGIRSSVFLDSIVIINGDSIPLSYPDGNWTNDFVLASPENRIAMLEKAPFNAFPAHSCVSASLLPYLEKTGILLIRRKSALDPGSHRPYLNSPSVVWVE